MMPFLIPFLKGMHRYLQLISFLWNKFCYIVPKYHYKRTMSIPTYLIIFQVLCHLRFRPNKRSEMQTALTLDLIARSYEKFMAFALCRTSNAWFYYNG